MPKFKISYVPILKTKAGERWALSHLKAATKAKLRPLLELHSHAEKTLGNHLGELCENLASDWGTDRWFYLDGIWLHNELGGATVLSSIFEASNENSLKAIPVVRVSFGDSALDAVQSIVGENERGYMLRITPAILDSPIIINNVVAAIGLPHNQVDLLLDYRHYPMELANDVPRIPNLADWRRLVAASGVFPKTQTTLTRNQWLTVNRADWTSWHTAKGLSRKPIFSDYTTRSPGAPAEFGIPRVNIRYATDSTWLFHQAGRFADGAAPEIHGLCEQLVNRTEFCGQDFSAGDQEYGRVTDHDEGPGGPTQWVQWAVSHHMEFAVDQVAAAGAP